MIGENYLKELPVNPFTNSSTVVANTSFSSGDSVYEITDSTDGWAYDRSTGNIVAIQP